MRDTPAQDPAVWPSVAAAAKMWFSLSDTTICLTCTGRASSIIYFFFNRQFANDLAMERRNAKNEMFF